MPIKLVCRCGRNLIVPEERAGRMIECPKCSHKMLVPGERKVIEPKRETPVAAPALAERKEPAKKERPAPPPDIQVKQPEESRPPPAAPITTPAARPVPPPLKSPPAIPTPPAVVAPPKLELPALPAPVVARAEPLAVVAPPPPPPPLPPIIPASAAPPAAKATVVPEPHDQQFGFQHDMEKLGTAYLLATLVALLGVVSMVPSVIDIVRFLGNTEGDPIGRFAFLLFFLGLLQLAYAVYVGQLPDWSSAWVLTGMTLLQAAFYAAVLTNIQLAKGGSQLVQMLDLGPHVDNGQVRAWCFIMLLLTGVVAYYCGSVSIRWRRAFITVRLARGR
ncbi:MAG TPA: hypothetical protein VL096_05965 [Pirellulaceae bacterium]|nr:hypothetical protein [Pirellulaceae bacterium]